MDLYNPKTGVTNVNNNQGTIQSPKAENLPTPESGNQWAYNPQLQQYEQFTPSVDYGIKPAGQPVYEGMVGISDEISKFTGKLPTDEQIGVATNNNPITGNLAKFGKGGINTIAQFPAFVGTGLRVLNYLYVNQNWLLQLL